MRRMICLLIEKICFLIIWWLCGKSSHSRRNPRAWRNYTILSFLKNILGGQEGFVQWMSLLIWLAPGLKGVNHILRKISIIICHNIQRKTLLFLLYQYFQIVVLHFLEKSLIKENSIYIFSSFSSINLLKKFISWLQNFSKIVIFQKP